MKFYSISYTKNINAPLNSIWNILAERFGDISQYSNSLKSSKYISEIKKGIGTARHCVLRKGGFVKEKVTVWEKHKVFEFEIIETSMPMEKGGKLNFKLSELSREDTRIEIFANFRLKYIPFLSPILKPKLRNIIEQMMVDIENATTQNNN